MTDPTSREVLQSNRWVRYARRQFGSPDDLESWSNEEVENLFTYRRSQITDYMIVKHGGFSFSSEKVYQSYSEVIRDLVITAIGLALNDSEES